MTKEKGVGVNIAIINDEVILKLDQEVSFVPMHWTEALHVGQALTKAALTIKEAEDEVEKRDEASKIILAGK